MASKQFRQPDDLSRSMSTTTETTKKVQVDAVFDLEKQYLDKIQQENLRARQLNNDKLENDNEARKRFGDWIFTIVVIWLFFVLLILVSVGNGTFKFDNSVLITMLTTTSVNIIGLLLVVARYLFNEKKST